MDANDAVVKTYRYLRVAVVGLALLLALSVGIEMFSGDNAGRLGSISAYYYTPVRSVFVGTLVAIGVAMIAIKGRDGVEDIFLNLAGMLAPIVAMVPTPIDQLPGETCPNNAERCIPESYIPGVENNVKSLALVGAIGVGFAWYFAVKTNTMTKANRWGLATSAVVVGAFAAVFQFAPERFFSVAHYSAAIPMFLFIVGVTFVNATRPVPDTALLLEASTYRRLYKVIAVSMGAAIGIAAGLFVIEKWRDRVPFPGYVFWIEAVLLGFFAVFWILQTMQFWNEGSPVMAEESDAPAS